jgi:hypothetical protein
MSVALSLVSDPVQRFGDIIENIQKIGRFTAGMNREGFAGNEQAVHSVNYAPLIISEAAVKLGDTATDLCPDIPWGRSGPRQPAAARLRRDRHRPPLAAARTRSARAENCLREGAAGFGREGRRRLICCGCGFSGRHAIFLSRLSGLAD